MGAAGAGPVGGFIGGTGSLLSAYSEGTGMMIEGDLAETQAFINARFLEMQAEDAMLRGKKESKLARDNVKRLAGDQRAALAAQGIDVSEGVSVDLLAETAEFGALDIQQIQNNAWREAFGYKAQAENLRIEGRYAKKAANSAARMTFLTGGLQAASQVTSGFSETKLNFNTPSKTAVPQSTNFTGTIDRKYRSIS